MPSDPATPSATARQRGLGQRPVIAWLTGLSGAGKSTIAQAAAEALTAAGRHVVVLDGDALRLGLNSDLGFTVEDRAENVRRTSEAARLMAEAGLVVVVALISPSRVERQRARAIAGDVPFLEVFVDTPLAVCEARDPKGLYRRARRGAIANFTGISAPYEAPHAPDLRLETNGLTASQTAEPLIVALLSLTAATA